ncbi:MAG: AraC family transcriptional regulator [Planctomycetes bacterium]|nr:AraC family transcriptional regulator [Planctomycetota bacterium]
MPRKGAAAGVVIDGPLQLPEVLALGLNQLGPTWRQHEHAHGHHEIHYVRRGSGNLICDGRAFPIREGSIYFFRPGESHGGGTDPSDPLQILYLSVRLPEPLPMGFDALRSDRPIFLDEPGVAELRAELSGLADGMAVLGGGRDEMRRFAGSQCPPELLAKMLRVLGALLEPVRRLAARSGTARERELAERVLRELDLCRGAPPALRVLARKLGVTPSHLGAALRQASGRTYPEAAAAIRVRNAQELLADERIPVREAARLVGLSSPRALARLFRRVTGKAPAAFRTK